MIYIGFITDRCKINDELFEHYDVMTDHERILLYRQGKEMDEVIGYYISKHAGLITLLINKIRFNQSDAEEVASLLFLSIHKALLTYDIDDHKSIFRTYCFSIVFFRELLMFLRKKKKDPFLITDISYYDYFTGESIEFFDKYLVENHNGFDDAETKMIFQKWYAKLNKLDKEIIDLCLCGQLQREIADDLGYSQSYISRRIRRLQKSLKKQL